MILDLKKLFVEDIKKVSGSYQIDNLISLTDPMFLFSPIKVNYNIENNAGLVELKASVDFNISHPCDRCTKQVEINCKYKFKHILVTSIDNEENDEYILLDNFKINLDEVITEDILLRIPSKILCKPDCKGLCQECGKDLNEGPCQCSKDFIDPRLEVLKSLLND